VLFRSAHLVHVNSAAVFSTVDVDFAVARPPARRAVAAIGLRDRASARRSSRRRPGPLRVLFVGRLEARKGIDDLLEAIATLGPAHPDVEWQIAGGETRPRTQPSHEALFRHRHRGAEWLRNVRFLGPVGDDELDQLYANADLVVLPSRYESFGLVMVEAMMHARAQVSCAVGGIEEVVRDGVDGLLVAPAAPAQLATAIDDLLRHPTRRRALAKAGRERYEAEFTIAAATARVDAMLDRVRFVPIDADGITALDPGPRLVVSGGHLALWLTRRTRVVVAPAARPARRTAAIHADAGHQVVLRTRDSLAQIVELRRGWNSVPLPHTSDDVVITVRRGEPIFGGLVSVAPEPT
jgi:hypothetical protein